MAYASNSLNLMAPVMGGGLDAGSKAPQWWSYISDDAVATVIAAKVFGSESLRRNVLFFSQELVWISGLKV